MANATLHDHFRPPLSTRRHWHAFHNAWATYLASDLNSRLPTGFFAEPNVQFGIEIDVATFDESNQAPHGQSTSSALWEPPAPVQTIPFTLATDIVEVIVYDSQGGPTLAGAIELVSPANKDRVAHREAFVSKCETYLQAGAGLLIVDVVTDRKGSLHDDLLDRLDSQAVRLGSDLYAAAYHVVERNAQPALDVWQQVLIVGQALPTMPLFLRGSVCLPVALDESYDRTCREQRFPVRETPAT
ncbi:MAG TPA: DUF4058 family protein [Tepidisphaeraceae bacterium]|jgi:hypothetical protein|nr:DUF4058 family protein [Tepidisphaeraceae bacterium]